MDGENQVSVVGEQATGGGEQITSQVQDVNTNTEVHISGGTEPDVQTQQPAQQTTDTKEVQDTYNQTQQQQQALKDDLTKRGVDFDEYVGEYTKAGKLSQESYDKLEKAGYPKMVIDGFISGIKASNDQMADAVFKSVGGQENFTQLAKFAQSMGDNVIDSWNKTVNSGDLTAISMMLKGVQSEFTAKYGTANPTIMGANGGGPVSTGFSSTAEMVKAMSDPKYGKDRAYTHEVENKVKVSKIFG